MHKMRRNGTDAKSGAILLDNHQWESIQKHLHPLLYLRAHVIGCWITKGYLKSSPSSALDTKLDNIFVCDRNKNRVFKIHLPSCKGDGPFSLRILFAEHEWSHLQNYRHLQMVWSDGWGGVEVKYVSVHQRVESKCGGNQEREMARGFMKGREEKRQEGGDSWTRARQGARSDIWRYLAGGDPPHIMNCLAL